jgi:ubiquinone biosynthesis protein UbiJ
MPALDALFRPLASLINRNIGEITPARELCARLDGKTIAVRVRDSGLVLVFEVHEDVVSLARDGDREPDAAISGSLLTLLRVLRGGGETALRDGSLELIGDTDTASAFQKLLGYARPDVEEELAGIVGDAAAHRLAEVARDLRDWARRSGTTMAANVGEYLQEESRDVPSRFEYERFSADVDTLRDDVDRAAARVDRLTDRD